MPNKPYKFTRDKVTQMLARFAEGELIKNIVGDYNTTTSAFYDVLDSHYSELYAAAKIKHARVMSEQTESILHNTAVNRLTTNNAYDVGHIMLLKEQAANKRWRAKMFGRTEFGDKLQTDNTTTTNVNTVIKFDDE